ncbi:hypothetical protein RDI58_010306 [Solanum bulbocastanum]|uniref:Uncharacterized protein n=1 Tax=Solanum bulbocastanum TaxID=147425 RepID=A0AAN8TP39_SOLBU
MCSGLLAKKP